MNMNTIPLQAQLRERLQDFVRQHYPLNEQLAASGTALGWRPDLWKLLSREYGLLGVATSKEAGGAGGSTADLMAVMQQWGGQLLAEPYLESVVMAGGILRRLRDDVSIQSLKSLCAGDAVFAVAWSEMQAQDNHAHVLTRAARHGEGWQLDGAKSVVMAAPYADSWLVTARTAGDAGDLSGISLFLVPRDAPGVDMKAFHTLDGRRAADLSFHRVQLPSTALLGQQGMAWDVLEPVVDEATVAACACAVGAMEQMFELTVRYMRERKQFGQPLAQFQALQHRVADMLMELEMARAALHGTVMQLEAEPEDRGRAVSAAKVTVDQAARRVGQGAIQLHGGMGMNENTLVTHYFRKTTVLGNLHGDVEHHLARHARLERRGVLHAAE